MDDNLQAIARGIYQTDPHIYPTMAPCQDHKAWLKLVSDCVASPNNIYNCDNLYVALCQDQIAAVACVICGGEKYCFAETLKVPEEIRLGVSVVADRYYGPLVAENLELSGYNIVNFCVLEEFRGKGIGSKLMNYLTEVLGSEQMHLDVIADNHNAIGLYQRYGFCVTQHYFGFSSNELPLPCLHMVRNCETAKSF